MRIARLVSLAMLAAAPVAAGPPDAPATPVVGKWRATLYGFVELDTLWDSTQSFIDYAGNAPIARPGTYAGNHGQTTFGARNSRFGYLISAPTHDDVTATAQVEMDFLGNQPPGITEAAFFQNPTLRVRHLDLQLATPIVDVLLGQSWQLFGWQSAFFPNTVEIQGVPGEVFGRAPQIRIGKTIHAGDLTLELAIAAARPPQRASSTPDVQAGIKLDLDGVRALHTAGGVATSLDRASIGLSVVGRRFAVDELSAAPRSQVVRYGHGLSLDALLPIVPATADDPANAITLTASYVTGAGIADLYTGLTGGVTQPALPPYAPNVDNGLVELRPDGSLHPVQWTSYLVGVQYYLPPRGEVWLSASYSHLSSSNAHELGDPRAVFDRSDWADGNLFVDVTPAVRLGVELAWFHQRYVDGADATSTRVQLSSWLRF